MEAVLTNPAVLDFNLHPNALERKEAFYTVFVLVPRTGDKGGMEFEVRGLKHIAPSGYDVVSGPLLVYRDDEFLLTAWTGEGQRPDPIIVPVIPGKGGLAGE